MSEDIIQEERLGDYVENLTKFMQDYCDLESRHLAIGTFFAIAMGFRESIEEGKVGYEGIKLCLDYSCDRALIMMEEYLKKDKE